MPNSYFCKLYIDTDEQIAEFLDVLNKSKFSIFNGVPVEVLTYRNEDFKAASRKLAPYDFIECSRYYVDVGVVREISEQILDFQYGVARLVSNLRDGRRFVIASCDFEDVIIEKTGWNWTKDAPEPPGRVIR